MLFMVKISELMFYHITYNSHSQWTYSVVISNVSWMISLVAELASRPVYPSLRFRYDIWYLIRMGFYLSIYVLTRWPMTPMTDVEIISQVYYSNSFCKLISPTLFSSNISEWNWTLWVPHNPTDPCFGASGNKPLRPRPRPTPTPEY